jgi:hypothetical protein
MRAAWQAIPVLVSIGCAPPDTGPGLPGGPGTHPSSDSGEGSTADNPLDWLQDNWTPTAEVCDFPEPFVWPETEDGNGDDMTWSHYLDDADACAEAIQRDLGIDLDSFGVEAHGSIDPDDYRPQTSTYRWLISGAWGLLARDAGTLASLGSEHQTWRAQWGVSDEFRADMAEAAEVLGQDEIRQLTYNIVKSSILEVRYGGYDEESSIDAEVTMDGSRIMTVYGQHDSRGMTIVHEAAHLYRNIEHVECPDIIGQHWTGYGRHLPGLIACDDDRSGVWGFEIALYTLYFEHWPDLYPEESDWGTWGGGQGGHWTWAAQDAAIPVISEWTEADGYWNVW